MNGMMIQMLKWGNRSLEHFMCVILVMMQIIMVIVLYFGLSISNAQSALTAHDNFMVVVGIELFFNFAMGGFYLLERAMR